MGLKSHESLYNRAKVLAKEQLQVGKALMEMEQARFGFSSTETESNRIINSISLGIEDLSFLDYLKEMEYYEKLTEENDGVFTTEVVG